jgi:ribosomal protein L12E/L44/L45/RPP1/RPP2
MKDNAATRIVAPILWVALVATLTGCGLGGRPSEDELADALRDPTNVISVAGITTDEATIDCLAKALHDSDVSDESLQAIVDDDPSYAGNADDADALPGLQAAMATCVPG